MQAYIEKLQSKPHHIRKRMFVGSLIVSMFIVVLVWVYSLGYRFNSDTQAKAQSDIKPFALFGESLSNTYKNITASVGNISNINKAEEPEEKMIDVIPVEKAN